MLQYEISAQYEGLTIKQFLKKHQQFSQRLLTSLTRDFGFIQVNQNNQRIDYRLKAKDQLKVIFPPEEKGARLIAEQIPLDIVFEDDYCLIINKRANIAVLPSFNYPSGTIANGILGYYEQNNIPYTVHIVTRLDRDTTGLMLVAKNRYSHGLFAKLLNQDLIERRYTAIVHGQMADQLGTIEAPIGRVKDSIIKRQVTYMGKQAITHYNTKEINEKFSIVHIRLETGRTHQIRVHFAHIGHPLVGDHLYGQSSDFIKRQALHCHQLSFIHPLTNKQMNFVVPLPEDMATVKEFI